MHSEVKDAGAAATPPGAAGRMRFWNRSVDGLAALGTVMIVITARRVHYWDGEEEGEVGL